MCNIYTLGTITASTIHTPQGVTHPLKGWGCVRGAFAATIAPPPRQRKGSWKTGCGGSYTCRPAIIRRAGPPCDNISRTIITINMIGKTLAANSNRRDAITRLHMEHQDQSPFYSKQTFVAASYLPANCGTTTVDVMDLLYNGSLHSFPSGNDHESSSTGRKTVSTSSTAKT